MTSQHRNPHKQGEHVFNDIAGSLDNAFTSAVRIRRADSLILANRYGALEMRLFPQTIAGLDRFRRDSVLTQARTVVAPATGLHNDLNSRMYGEARVRLEGLLAEIVVATAAFVWKKKPRANSSFREFDAVVASLDNIGVLKANARTAIERLMDQAHDPKAETDALTEHVSDTELARRRAAIALMKQHVPVLKQAGTSLINAFTLELEQVLELRIAAA